jgi:hypothetical protein
MSLSTDKMAGQPVGSPVPCKLESGPYGKEIKDVQLTENGSWLILWGRNGVSWSGLPVGLEAKINAFNDRSEEITSVTFNDVGDWIIITTTSIAASSTKVYDFIQDGMSKYGQLWSAHMTDDGMVLCYDRGYKYLGNVPANLKEKLRQTSMDVYRIKFLSDGAFFISDRLGNYSYYL